MLLNILVIKLSALGDFIQALGPMKAIRKHFPEAKITLLTTEPFVSLAQKSGYIDDVIVDSRPKWYQISDWLRLKKALNTTRFEHVFDLQNNPRVRRYSKLISYDFMWHSIEDLSERHEHAHTRHKKILARSGIDNVSLDRLDWVGKEVSVEALDVEQPFALIVPGCDPSRPEKRWPAVHYAELAAHIHEKGILPVIIGTQHEQKEADTILKACPKAMSLIGKTSLFDIPALARKARFAVGNDTGPMHMIGPTGCQSLVLFSYVSDPIKHAPIGKNVETLRTESLTEMPVSMVLEALKDK